MEPESPKINHFSFIFHSMLQLERQRSLSVIFICYMSMLEDDVHIAVKLGALAVLLSAAGPAGVGAQALYHAPYRAPASSSMMLPELAVPGRGVTPPHYRVPAGYDSDVALHPYTSGLGPCTEGAVPNQGCHHSTSHPIAPSHYERPPFTR